MVPSERGFFDLSAVRHLTMDVEAKRVAVVRAAVAYASLDVKVFDDSNPDVHEYDKARQAYLEACCKLVNAMYAYWPEFFKHDVPF